MPLSFHGNQPKGYDLARLYRHRTSVRIQRKRLACALLQIAFFHTGEPGAVQMERHEPLFLPCTEKAEHIGLPVLAFFQGGHLDIARQGQAAAAPRQARCGVRVVLIEEFRNGRLLQRRASAEEFPCVYRCCRRQQRRLQAVAAEERLLFAGMGIQRRGSIGVQTGADQHPQPVIPGAIFNLPAGPEERFSGMQTQRKRYGAGDEAAASGGTVFVQGLRQPHQEREHASWHTASRVYFMETGSLSPTGASPASGRKI